MIRSQQIGRTDAIAIVDSQPYAYKDELIEYIISKFNISSAEWDELYNASPKRFLDYPTYYPLMKRMKRLVKVMTDLNILPELLYLKYLY